MAVVKLTSENFEKEIKAYEGIALIDFYADWCGPCKMVSPVVDEIAETQDKYKICKVNVDDESDLAAQFSVMSIPTLVVMKNGEVADTHIGLAGKSKILAMLESAQ
ncbi:MAG: thioredoxin [Clostridia bacterium]|nr:thioredoxin [Clostridia bacterium]